MALRRYYIPNAIAFITQVVAGREPVFRVEAHVDLLRSTLRKVQELHPFRTLAYAFLPEDFHWMLVPTGESSFSRIMHSLKPNYSKAYKEAAGIRGSLTLWQRRFYDHIIRDEKDLARHLDYIHYNPVKHGLVSRPEDWPHGSFRIWKERGVYEDEWGGSEPEALIRWDGRIGE